MEVTKIKLCGLFRKEDIEQANAVNPDYVGFVLAPSRRQITYEQAKEFRKLLNTKIPAVGVFVNESNEKILEYLNQGIIDIAQLHGNETDEDILYIQYNSNKPVIKAIKITEDTNLSDYQKSPADFLLLDSGSGTGEVFNWEKITGLNRPFFLAGGITLDNVELAMKQVKPYGIDVSSGIETNQLKDGGKMRAMVERMRHE